MKHCGELRIDPGSLGAGAALEELEIAIPFTDREVTGAVLERAAALTAGLNARIGLVAVHTVPYPATFECPAAVHAYLVKQLLELSSRCALPVDARVVLARSREEGFHHLLSRESIVLLGTRKHWWRTPEEGLARTLARDGYKVVLLHIA